MFPVALSNSDKRMLRDCGAKVIVLHAGDMVIFKPRYHHQVTNLERDTLSTHGIVLTFDTLNLCVEDTELMRAEDQDELLWFGNVLNALYRQLKAHLDRSIVLQARQLRILVITINDMVVKSYGKRSTFSRLFTKKEFRISDVQKLLKEKEFQKILS